MSYDMNGLRWVLTRRYYNLLQRVDAGRLGTTAPAKGIINALMNRILADGLACHYCGVPLNLYAHAYDFKTALSLDHKVPLSVRPDNSATRILHPDNPYVKERLNGAYKDWHGHTHATVTFPRTVAKDFCLVSGLRIEACAQTEVELVMAVTIQGRGQMVDIVCR